VLHCWNFVCEPSGGTFCDENPAKVTLTPAFLLQSSWSLLDRSRIEKSSELTASRQACSNSDMIFLSSFNRRLTFFEMGLRQMNGQEASSFTIDLRLIECMGERVAFYACLHHDDGVGASRMTTACFPSEGII
jgi:hypothetical protein